MSAGTWSVPQWAARVLGLPGSVSFRRFGAFTMDAEALAPEIGALSDDELRTAAATLGFDTAARLTRQATARFLAIAREAADRTLGLRAFDEQLVACCALLSGHAVEMDTGEGKTLVGALAAAGHALAGRRVHVLSVNDYLAERDATWMRPFFDLLGMTVAWVGQHTPPDERRAAYRSDIVYAPVSEIGFDLLRDRFAVQPSQRVAPVFEVAIVDEADAVMIDEAMVPLVLAGTSEHAADDFAQATRLVAALEQGTQFTMDPEGATVALTDAGLDSLEASLGGVNLYSDRTIATLTRINLALHARVLVRRDVDYLVDDGVIRLINSGRGRVAHLQRWPDGLHSAIEAKENLQVSTPGVILDTVTVQDLLGGYRVLSGMSGTILPVAEDLLEFYRLPAGRVQRHRPGIRLDEPDRVVLTGDERLAAVAAEVRRRHRVGQPVLVGTQSVAESENLARILVEQGMRPTVLNARNDAEEAGIIARAGEYAAVTISTQMSGRGTDIRLGGAVEQDRERVVALGGLAVIATGRYPSRRLDAQLRGRSGRQGDPGVSVTFVALDDELVKTTVPDHVLTEIARSGENMTVARRGHIVAAAQSIAEALRLDRHRSTWAYNRAIALQRENVLAYRERVATSSDAIDLLRARMPDHLASLERAHAEAVADTVRAVTLFYLDENWLHHLALLQEVRDGIHLRALAGQKPVDEFHRIALREFHGYFEAVSADVDEFIGRLTADDVGRDLADLGLRRPSATWTYMVSDNPLGNPGDRLARELGRRWRSRILRIE